MDFIIKDYEAKDVEGFLQGVGTGGSDGDGGYGSGGGPGFGGGFSPGDNGGMNGSGFGGMNGSGPGGINGSGIGANSPGSEGYGNSGGPGFGGGFSPGDNGGLNGSGFGSLSPGYDDGGSISGGDYGDADGSGLGGDAPAAENQGGFLDKVTDAFHNVKDYVENTSPEQMVKDAFDNDGLDVKFGDNSVQITDRNEDGSSSTFGGQVISNDQNHQLTVNAGFEDGNGGHGDLETSFSGTLEDGKLSVNMEKGSIGLGQEVTNGPVTTDLTGRLNFDQDGVVGSAAVDVDGPNMGLNVQMDTDGNYSNSVNLNLTPDRMAGPGEEQDGISASAGLSKNENGINTTGQVTIRDEDSSVTLSANHFDPSAEDAESNTVIGAQMNYSPNENESYNAAISNSRETFNASASASYDTGWGKLELSGSHTNPHDGGEADTALGARLTYSPTDNVSIDAAIANNREAFNVNASASYDTGWGKLELSGSHTNPYENGAEADTALGARLSYSPISNVSVDAAIANNRDAFNASASASYDTGWGKVEVTGSYTNPHDGGDPETTGGVNVSLPFRSLKGNSGDVPEIEESEESSQGQTKELKEDDFDRDKLRKNLRKKRDYDRDDEEDEDEDEDDDRDRDEDDDDDRDEDHDEFDD